jgi:chromate transporter
VSPLDLFFDVLRAAALSVGGAGSLPLLRESLVVPGHVTEAQVLESLAIGRLSTGPTGLYVVSLGYFALGWAGAAIALAAATLPPLSLVALASLGRRWLLTPWASGVIRGIALSTSGLLIATSVQLIEVGVAQVLLALAGIGVTLQGRIHPALAIFAGAVAGVVLEAL